MGLLLKVRQLRWRAVFCIMMAALAATPLLASGAGPGGVNIGLDFNWGSGPAGQTASFLAGSSGSGNTLDNCGGSVTPSTTSCDFVFSYSIGGVAQPAVSPGGVYDTWTPPGVAGRICDSNPFNSAPLTLYNCFNSNSFGQIFTAGSTGLLSGVTMSFTCQNPTGQPPTGLFAVIYQLNSGLTTPATPLAQVPVDLSTCPTLASWTGHTFTSGDFAAIPLNFSGVVVTSGSSYGVYFGGNTPGIQPSGLVPTTPAPPTWLLLLVGLAGIGWLSRRRFLGVG